jgi:hypothetical protein
VVPVYHVEGVVQVYHAEVVQVYHEEGDAPACHGEEVEEEISAVG